MVKIDVINFIGGLKVQHLLIGGKGSLKLEVDIIWSIQNFLIYEYNESRHNFPFAFMSKHVFTYFIADGFITCVTINRSRHFSGWWGFTYLDIYSRFISIPKTNPVCDSSITTTQQLQFLRCRLHTIYSKVPAPTNHISVLMSCQLVIISSNHSHMLRLNMEKRFDSILVKKWYSCLSASSNALEKKMSMKHWLKWIKDSFGCCIVEKKNPNTINCFWIL